jgi:hypothetical protein
VLLAMRTTGASVICRLVVPRVVLGPRSVLSFRRVINIILGNPCGISRSDRVLRVALPSKQPVVPEPGGPARAAETMATNITAMSVATVANNRMRFSCASPLSARAGLVSPAFS